MKIIQTGSTYKIYGEDLVVLDNLPVQTYKVGCGQFTGFYLEKQHDLEVKENKIYGVHEEKAAKVLNRFEKSNKNLGVILSGDKGIGKSLFARILSQKAIANGIPVILVDQYIPGITDFLNDIKNEVLVLFDEFDKTFKPKKEDDPQAAMLSLFDGTSCGKKLFIVTCNRYGDLNEFMINRPGRFHFHFRFDYPTPEEVKEYLHDKLDEKYCGEIKKVAVFSRKVKLNFDCLSAIAIELNEGLKFEDAIKDLNIINIGENRKYSVRLYTNMGIVFSTSSTSLNLFGDSTNSVSLWGGEDDDANVYIEFKGRDAMFDDRTNRFILPENSFRVTSKYFDDDDEEKKYKDLKYTYVEIVLNRDSNIHYTV